MSNQLSSLPRQGVSSRQAETVERLLVAAAEQLREGGHEALTMRIVAGRAGVSPATAYTYFASRNHLFAELFLRDLGDDPVPDAALDEELAPVTRVQAITRRLADFLAGRPELAAAVTPALLSTDQDVARLRLRIGGQFVDRFRAALGAGGGAVDGDLLEALNLAFAGALLQAGMGVTSYAEVGDQLDSVVAVIMEGGR